ncbi:MAG TPA: glycosyltransferase [Bryobacteraceae bacterium]|jgi:hypothetical protein|nr:glycosyltransferase [Bryobacteraceae bacterium]
MDPIPNDYHFIFALRPRGKPFSLVHYVAIASCQAVNRPRIINFYCQFEPSGYWWEKAKPLVNVIRIDPPPSIFGNPLVHAAHVADVVRLEVLIEHGGVYLDVDIVSLRPFVPLMEFDTVLGEEYGVGLCNAVILARPGSPFLRRWLEAYRSFDGRKWNMHSVQVPSLLARQTPDQVHIVDHTKFFWPMYWQNHLQAFFHQPGSTFSAQSFCVHLWESVTWPYLGSLTVQDIVSADSEFASLMRPYVEEFSGSAAL